MSHVFYYKELCLRKFINDTYMKNASTPAMDEICLTVFHIINSTDELSKIENLWTYNAVVEMHRFLQKY